MKIVAFLGEKFVSVSGVHYTRETSAAFLQDMIGVDSVKVISQSIVGENSPEGAGTIIKEDNFYSSPWYDSTMDFVKKSIFKKGYLRKFIDVCDKAILENQDSIFWARTPSIGSVIFALRVIKHNRSLVNHICADGFNTWKDRKYKGVNKVLAFVFAQILKQLLIKICKYENVQNLCTGQALFDFSAKHNKENTYQFVDTMVKRISSNQRSTSNKELLNCLFVGRLTEDKGIFELLSVAKRLSGKVKFHVVGGGEIRSELEKRILLDGLESSVIFYGQVKNHDVIELYKIADFVAVPSKNNYEGFPRVIMESWSSGKPVVVSDVGGIHAFVKDGVNGFIVPPGDVDELEVAILKFCNKKTLDDISSNLNQIQKYTLQAYWAEKAKEIIKNQFG
ncbi:glycosyltransferase [Pseudoalteromonas phenolica]|uniref:glycosyltransferase n=1 Tax=Pseudoalteromonas phenolica TaxID=161398 RepID=UPI00110B15B3|nr:glycosyltransferase [Pseudoalteromonas phenolica]TMO52882.1 hypothetical protein CWC21_21460 [Pseudoalteromonas phenolica]